MPIRPLDSAALHAAIPGNTGRALLEKANPALPQLIKDNPGVGALVARLEHNGLILEPKPGDKKSEVEFSMWSHSKQSGSMPVEPFKDLIVAYQYDEKGRDLGIGGGGWCKGKVVGVFRLDQMAFASAAEAKAFNGKLTVKEFEPGKFVHVSDDPVYRGSYEWSPMTVPSYGENGKPFTMRWAIVGLDNQGNVLGGGYSGWEGREVDGTFGKDIATAMPDH